MVKRILIVDDNPVVAEFCAGYLKLKKATMSVQKQPTAKKPWNWLGNINRISSFSI